MLTYREWNAPIGVSLEAGYISKGVSINADTLDYQLEYIGGPILFDYYWKDKFKFSIGPEFAVLTGANNTVNDTTTVDITSSFNNRFEFGGTVSASYSLTFFLDVGVRYNIAFRSIADFDPRTQKTDIRTSYGQFFLLFKIAN